jgi:peroxiredoxin
MSPRAWPLLFVLFGLPALADDAVPAKPGHSMLGETFNEGPRQFAHLLPGCTSVHFPVTTASPEAQKFIDQGVTQLHGFWYFEAERSFRQAAYLDRDCAMAYQGMAMANVNNMKRAAGFSAEAVKRRGQASPREQRWIDARAGFCNEKSGDEKARRAALVKAYEDLIADFPEDLEARAFLLYQLWDDSTEGIPLPSRLAVASLAQPVLAANPMHPGIHHYLIHLWNKDGTDKRALPDAALCGQSAPAIAHLWHMPGHTYSSLHRYADAAWQQEASARTDHAYMREARILPEQIFNYAHNNDWLAKDLGYIGRVHDAMALARNLVELPRLGPGSREGAWHLGRERLMEVGTTFELWDELASLDGTAYLAPDPDPVPETHRLRALALAWYGKGEPARGNLKLALLERQLAAVKAERIPEAARAEAASAERKEPEEKAARAIAESLRRNTQRAEALESVLAEVRAARDLAMDDYAGAWEEFPKVKGLDPLHEALWRGRLGDEAGAETALRKALQKDAGQVLPYALLAQAEEREKKSAEADHTFDELRSRSADLDLDVPAFARLAAIAARRGQPADWRIPQKFAADTGVRPALDDLGPFRWSPYLAPPLSLPDATRQTVTLESRHGKPVLLLFYLGAGCGRCIRQLNAFAPAAADFTKAGIEIIAVSTDSPEGLKSTFEQAKGESFPFAIVSDPERTAFRAFRAFDDFEKIPLHGAFLIDGAGLVRWQNISYEPFEDTKWLLEESKRLLALPAQAAGVASTR